MPKKKYKCIICGKEFEANNGMGERYQTDYGLLCVCYKSSCKNLLTLKINDGNFPVIWIGPPDLYEEDYNEILTRKEMDEMPPEDMIQIAQDTAEALGDFFWDEYREAVVQAADWWREKKEKEHIETCPKEDLPLLINDIKYKNNKEIFEKRLKEKNVRRRTH